MHFIFKVVYEFTHSFMNFPMTSFDCNIHSQIFPDVIKYDGFQSTRDMLNWVGGVR